MAACDLPQAPASLLEAAAPPPGTVGLSLLAALDADPSAEASGFLSVDTRPLVAGAPDLQVALPGDAKLQAFLTSHYVLDGDPAATVWSGEIETVDRRPARHGDSALFVVAGDRVTAQLTFDARTVELMTVEEGCHVVLVERDFARLPSADDPPVEVQAEPTAPPLPSHARPAAPSPRVGHAVRPQTADVVVRVLQIASPEARRSLGGREVTKDRLRFFLAQANQAFANSGTGVRFANAGLRLPSAGQSTQNAERLLRRLWRLDDGLTYDHLAGGPATGNGREGTRADLVGLVVDELYLETGQPGYRVYPRGQAASIGGGANRAFFTVRANATEHTFTHEIGHLFGGRHQPAQDSTTAPYAYGHGFRYLAPRSGFGFGFGGFTVDPDDFRTVMGVGPDGERRIPYFSSDTRRRRGMVIGDAAERDNERVMRQRRLRVAAFR